MIVRPTLNENVFTIRFKALYEYYKQSFMDNKDPAIIIDQLILLLKLDKKYIYSNLKYLENLGFLNEPSVGVFQITYKGVAFVEEITKGEINYNDGQIIDDVSHITKKFGWKLLLKND